MFTRRHPDTTLSAGGPIVLRGFMGMTELTDLQARLFAGRALRAVKEQEEEARQLRPVAEVPSQRPAADPPDPSLTLVVDGRPHEVR